MIMPLTAGKVTYSKTIQERQFEPKHAAVEISFEVGDKEELAALLDEAKEIAKQECWDLIGTRKRD
jgi:hypothetical protein